MRSLSRFMRQPCLIRTQTGSNNIFQAKPMHYCSCSLIFCGCLSGLAIPCNSGEAAPRLQKFARPSAEPSACSTSARTSPICALRCGCVSRQHEAACIYIYIYISLSLSPKWALSTWLKIEESWILDFPLSARCTVGPAVEANSRGVHAVFHA